MATISPAGSSLESLTAPLGFTPCGPDTSNGSMVRSTIPYSLPLGLRFANGRYRIRTCVTEVTDLQSVPFNHSGNLPETGPKNSLRFARQALLQAFAGWRPLAERRMVRAKNHSNKSQEPAEGLEPPTG